MDYFGKLCIGIIVGLFVYFVFPRDTRARPLTAAVFGFIGAAIGAFLSQHIRQLGGPEMNPTSALTAAGGAIVFSLAYLGMSS